VKDSISKQSEQASRDAGGDTSTNKICHSAPRAVVIRLARRQLLGEETLDQSGENERGMGYKTVTASSF